MSGAANNCNEAVPKLRKNKFYCYILGELALAVFQNVRVTLCDDRHNSDSRWRRPSRRKTHSFSQNQDRILIRPGLVALKNVWRAASPRGRRCTTKNRRSA